MGKSALQALSIVVLLFVTGSHAVAQNGQLAGRVTDEQGGAIAGVEVQLVAESGAIVRTARSDSRGEYRIEAIAGEAFLVVVEKTGFRRHVEPLTVAAQGTGSLDVQLSVGGIDESVVVTAAGLPQLGGETSKAVSLIDKREIAERNEATLTEVVRFVPGVQVRDNGGMGQLAQLRIRGVRSDGAGVLVDGLRFRDASTTQGDVTSFLSNLNVIATDRVEVLRGSGSSLYGTNAVGGVVNIVTSPGGAPFGGDAQFEGGSLGFVRARGAVNGGSRDNRVAFSAGGLQWNVADGLDGQDSARSSGGQGMIRVQLTPATNVKVRLFGSDDRADSNSSPSTSGIPAANIPNEVIVDAIAVAPDQVERADAGLPVSVGNATYYPGRNDPDSTRESWFLTSLLQLQHVQSNTVSWQASYQRVHTNRVYRNGPLGPGFQSSTESLSNFVGDIDTIDARAILQPTGSISLIGGYEFEREGYFDRQDDNQPAPFRVATTTGISQYSHAAFGSANFALAGRKVQLSLAGRWQGFHLQPIELSAVGANHSYANVEIGAPPTALTGDVSLAYLAEASRTKVRTHIGNAYRAAALYERFGGGFSMDPVSNTILFSAYGDPRLEPDRYRTFDAGVDQSLWRDRIMATATVFYIDVQSLTAFDFEGQVNPATDPFGRFFGYVNGSGGSSKGVELSLDARPTARLRVSASYTYTATKTVDDLSVPEFFEVLGVFPHTATFLTTNQWTSRVDTTFDLFYGSDSYGPLFAAGRTRAFRYPSFTKAAVIGRVRLAGDGDRAVRAYLKIDNLFDQTYYQGGWRALGRTAIAGVSTGF